MTGTPTPSDDRSTTDDRSRHRLTRYDLLLLVVPAAFLVALLAVGLAGVPLRVATSAAAGVSALALVDGLFFNPPRRPTGALPVRGR